MSTDHDIPADQRQREARRAVVIALIAAFLGAMLGLVAAVIPGTVTGAEAAIIYLCLAVTAGLLVFVALRPAMTTGVITGSLSVYFVFHLNAGAIVAYQASGDLLRIMPYVIWFFPLVVFHRFTNTGFFRRPIDLLIGLGPAPVMVYVGARLIGTPAIVQLDAVLTFVASFLAFVLFVGFFARHRDAEVMHAARTDQAERSAEALRLSDERFRLLGQATSDLVWDADLTSGKVWWSDELLTVYGYDSDTLGAGLEDWERWVHPEDHGRVMDSLRAAQDGPSDFWSCEYRFICADGHALEVVSRGLVLRDILGAPIRMIGSTSDVTGLRDLERRLRQAHKMEALGQLTGGIAHDFNNLLTVILGSSEFLTESLTKGTKEHQFAETTMLAAEHAATLTSRLLSFARLQPLVPVHIEVPTLLTDIRTLIRRTINQDIEIRMRSAPGTWPIEVDPGQLENAILNLVINARDAMPDGGRLTIEASNVLIDAGDQASEEGIEGGHYVMIAVTDTGGGMTPDVVERAFEPFFTTKEAGMGSGMGLSMIWGFVRQSSGHARIYSEPGEGTTVKLYFPASAVEQPEVVDSAVVSRPAGGPERILVVEDDELVRGFVMSQLAGLGYQVQEASSAAQALLLMEEGRPFDLLFTDVVMPGHMNGRQLADEARRREPDLRILFTSGYTEDAIVHQGRLDPGVNLLSKPYRRKQLADKVRSVLDA